MNILQATQNYEAWLRTLLPLIQRDLQLKHEKMARSPFGFLRATFYRWAQIWPGLCPEPAAAPRVLSVGDLHADNFGTWRDIEGRLIWGINDLDEAYPLPYTGDLVRLATSLRLACTGSSLSSRDLCDAVLEGYRESLDQGGEPLVLTDRHSWLRRIALLRLSLQRAYWEKIDRLPTVPAKSIPPEVHRILQAAIPRQATIRRVVHRQAGLGSLGRPRFLILADVFGGRVAREAKALTPSACAWAHGAAKLPVPAGEKLLRKAIRAPDPYLAFHGHWIVRRIGPDCSRIEMAEIESQAIQLKLARKMGWETANLHLGSTRGIASIRKDLRSRPARWLQEASRVMSLAIEGEWREWRTSRTLPAARARSIVRVSAPSDRRPRRETTGGLKSRPS